MKIMKERVISVDERDQQVWNLITDVPKLKSPGSTFASYSTLLSQVRSLSSKYLPFYRLWHYDLKLFLRQVEQDHVHDRSLLAFLSLHPDWLDIFYLLGSTHCEEELGRSTGAPKLPGQDLTKERLESIQQRAWLSTKVRWIGLEAERKGGFEIISQWKNFDTLFYLIFKLF